MLEVLAGIACLLLAGYQLFTAYKSRPFLTITNKANFNRS